MKYLDKITGFTNIERPLVYLGGVISEKDDWQAEAIAVLKDVPGKGTIVNPRKTFLSRDVKLADSIGWMHMAMINADLTSFWFGEQEGMANMAFFDLGHTLGRYSVGAGPKRILVSTLADNPFWDGVGVLLDIHNVNLQGPWKVNVGAVSLGGHIKNIISTIGFLK